jgi:hypothetical protein
MIIGNCIGHIRKSEQPLILGDVGCLFEVHNAKRFKSLSDKDDVTVAAYLPISSDTIVVGTGGSAMSLDLIEMPTFTTPLELQVDYLFNVTKRTKLQSSLSTKGNQLRSEFDDLELYLSHLKTLK